METKMGEMTLKNGQRIRVEFADRTPVAYYTEDGTVYLAEFFHNVTDQDFDALLDEAYNNAE